jgi:hypothetical protein
VSASVGAEEHLETEYRYDSHKAAAMLSIVVECDIKEIARLEYIEPAVPIPQMTAASKAHVLRHRRS